MKALLTFFGEWLIFGCLSMLLMFMFNLFHYNGLQDSVVVPMLIGLGTAVSSALD